MKNVRRRLNGKQSVGPVPKKKLKAIPVELVPKETPEALSGGVDSDARGGSKTRSVSPSSSSSSSSSSSTSSSSGSKSKIKKQFKGLRQEHDSWDVVHPKLGDVGFIKYDARLGSLSAHCRHEEHDGSNKCRCKRSVLRSQRGRHSCAGRPIGFLLAWLFAAKHVHFQKKHHSFSCRVAQHSKKMTWKRRREAREWAKQEDSLNTLFEGIERDQDSDEDSEPEEAMYYK